MLKINTYFFIHGLVEKDVHVSVEGHEYYVQGVEKIKVQEVRKWILGNNRKQ